MSIVLVGSTSGSITLQEPAIAGSTIINLPATSGTALVAPTALTVPNTTGTVMVSGNMPAFSAYLSSNQTVSNTTFTKLQASVEEFDTASCYDTSNYRFTPNVAGYYQVNGSINITASTNNTEVVCVIFKNGSQAKWGTYSNRSAIANDMSSVASALIYMNGSTDYVELFGYINGTGTLQFIGTQPRTFFQASLVRSA